MQNKEKIIISPSILSADFSKLGEDIKLIEESGADWVHVDVMDGHFVPNITIGAPVVRSIRKTTKLPLDVHLMISEPERYVEDFVNAGSDIITFHIEAAGEKTLDIIRKIKYFGVKAGISVKPKTPAKDIEKYIEHVDMVLIMTVEPGFGGQSFMPECAEKISEVRHAAELIKKDLIIQVDGGINAETAKICRERGANSLVAGSYVYGANNVAEAILSLKS